MAGTKKETEKETAERIISIGEGDFEQHHGYKFEERFSKSRELEPDDGTNPADELAKESQNIFDVLKKISE